MVFIEDLCITLSNGEFFEVNHEDVGFMLITDFDRQIAHTGFGPIIDHTVAKTTVLELLRSANYTKEIDGKEVDMFKYLSTHRDISLFELYRFEDVDDYDSEDDYDCDEDGNERTVVFAVVNPDDNDENLFQHTYLSKNGNLYIVISSDLSEDIKDYFDMKLIDSPDYMRNIEEKRLAFEKMVEGEIEDFYDNFDKFLS